MTRSSTDVVVIGAGIVGCAAAYFLSKRGIRTVVLERKTVGAEQSGRAWGFIRTQGRHPAELPLAREATDLWMRLSSELQEDVEYCRGGILVVAKRDRDVSLVENGARIATGNGLDTRLLTAREIAELVPELQGNWRAASYTQSDGNAEPIKATRAFAAAAERRGVRIRLGTKAIAIESQGGRVNGVVTDQGRITADAVLCAAGTRGADLLEACGVTIPIRVVRSSVAETNPIQPFTRIAVWAPKVAYRPTVRGTFYLGNGYAVTGAEHDVTLSSLRHFKMFWPSYLNNWRRMKLNIGRPLFDDLAARSGLGAPPSELREPEINQRKISFHERSFYELFPNLQALGLQRSWAGQIDLTPDMIPAIGTVRGMPGVFVAMGFSGHGFALGPVVGKLISELIAEGRTSLDISSFDPRRFETGRVEPAREIL